MKRTKKLLGLLIIGLCIYNIGAYAVKQVSTITAGNGDVIDPKPMRITAVTDGVIDPKPMVISNTETI